MNSDMNGCVQPQSKLSSLNQIIFTHPYDTFHDVCAPVFLLQDNKDTQAFAAYYVHIPFKFGDGVFVGKNYPETYHKEWDRFYIGEFRVEGRGLLAECLTYLPILEFIDNDFSTCIWF